MIQVMHSRESQSYILVFPSLSVAARSLDARLPYNARRVRAMECKLCQYSVKTNSIHKQFNNVVCDFFLFNNVVYGRLLFNTVVSGNKKFKSIEYARNFVIEFDSVIQATIQ